METEGNFTWVDGTPWGGFTNFDAGQPNDFGDGEDCLEVAAHRDWKWNDADCTFTRTYFCVV